MAFTPISEDTDFAFPDGVFDLRGWEVRAMTDGEKVGEVEDLLIDESGRIRYLDVDLSTFRKHVLVPVDRARADEAEGVVWVPGMDRSRFEAVPRYDHDPETLTREYEDRVTQAYTGGWPAGASGAHPGRMAVEGAPPRTEPAAGAQEIPIETARTRAPRTGPLASLSELGEYEVASGEADARGWDLVLADDRRVGMIHDLLIEPAALKVRYLDCELTAPEHGHPAGGRHILVPVDYARLDLSEKIVYVDAISSSDLTDLPSFPGIPLAPEAEDRIFEVFTHGSNGEGWDRG
jgi:hypothetical protein